MELFTALLLIALPVVFNLLLLRLRQAFDYPDIRRQSPGEVLARYHAGGNGLRRSWYLAALSAAIFIPLPVLVQLLFGALAPWYLIVGSLFGVLAGLVQAVALLRWSFLAPALAERHQRAAAASLEREALEIVHDAVDRFAGAAGDHLGLGFAALWSLVVSFAILETALFPDWLGWLGLAAGAGLAAGLAEAAGISRAALVGAAGFILWSFWLVAFGVVLLIG